MKSGTLLKIGCALLSGAYVAMPVVANDFVNTGSNANHFSLYAAASNPAMAELQVAKDEKWRMSFGPGIGTYNELGKVDDFVDELQDLADLLDDPASATDSVQETLDHFNNVLEQMGEEGYVTNGMQVHLPVFPLYYRSSKFGGTFFSEYTWNSLLSASVLDDELAYNDQNGNFSTNTSVYLKGAVENRISLGYSRLLEWDGSSPYDGDIYGGVRLSMNKIELSKQVLALTEMAGEEISDVIQDEYDRYLRSTTAFSLDVGFMWDTEKFRTGITFKNVNGPSYAYGEIGGNCEELPDASAARSNCEVARYYTQVEGEINANEVYRQYSRLTLDGLYKFSNNLLLSAAWDTDSYVDAVGNERRWMKVAGVYESGRKAIPSLRLGYQKNMAGSQLAAFNAGLTLFQSWILEVNYGTEEVSVDGTTLPRNFGFLIAFQEYF